MDAVKVSDFVRQKAMSLGDEGTKWLNSLRDIISGLEHQWNFVAVGECLDGGSEAYVTKAKTNDGLDVVVKIGMPQMEGNSNLVNEIQCLSIADGQGYARLLKYDMTWRALLLEQLGSPLRELALPTQEQIKILCATLNKCWKPVPQGASLQSGESVAMWMADFIERLWNKFGRPSSELAFKTALSYATSRVNAHRTEPPVLIHGDANSSNLLQSLGDIDEMEFKFIDPDGIIGEPAYDLGVIMREWTNELIHDPLRLGRERCELISSLTGIKQNAIWEWGFLQCMTTGLLLVQIGNESFGRQFFKIADAWAQGVNY